MTKKFTAFLTALLCMTGTVLSLPVSAEYRIENGQLVGDISDFNAGLTMPDEDDLHVDNVRPEPKPEYTYTTATFTYKTNSAYGGGSGFLSGGTKRPAGSPYGANGNFSTAAF